MALVKSLNMKSSHEIYGNLARLLATENLIIEHSNVDTASFNVDTRTLTLPVWEKASDVVYQLLLSHEAGHAIYTSTENWSELTAVPMQFLNVTEDVRIEKLMKRRYPGLKKTFYNGYKELNDEDFFSIADDDVSKYNLADRVNLYFKIGNFIELEFNEEEKDILKKIEDAETFMDAIKAAELLYEYCKKVYDNETNLSIDVSSVVDNLEAIGGDAVPGDKKEESRNQSSDEVNVDDDLNSDDSSKSSGDTTLGKSDQSKSDGQKKSTDYDTKSNSDFVKTASSLEKAINSLSSSNFEKLNYVEIPKLDIDNIIVSNSKIHSLCKRYWDMHNTEEDFASVDIEFKKFKNGSKNEVNYLVKEFECKKAAESYSRSSESKTGVLDCTSLFSYKYNDDIFKKIVTVAEGKNHGLIFILDWSGSMDKVILDTCCQLLNLVWFCKKVSIPFEVYAFTNNWSYSYGKASGKLGSLCVEGNYNLLNFISSTVNSATLELHMKNLYRLACTFTKENLSFTYPRQLELSGTPLNETMVALHQIIPMFQKKTKVQKIQCVVLTDGESGALNRISSSGICPVGDNCFLRDNTLKTTYRFPKYSYYASHKFTDVLLKHLKDVFPQVNFIGIRLLSSGEVSNFIKRHVENHDNCVNKIWEEWKQNKSCAIKCSGYDCYFGIYSNSLNSNSDFQVSHDASVTEIRNAFKRSLQSKKMNKKILSQFVDLIA